MNKIKQYMCFALVYLLLCAQYSFCVTFQNFDNFPVTGTNDLPGNSTDNKWIFATPTANPDIWITPSGASGWYNGTDTYNNGIYTYFRNYVAAGGTGGDHMGYPTYGYIDIAEGHTGNALRFTTTGGENNIDQVHGTELYSKEAYLLLGGESTISTDETSVGHPYIYFGNTSISPNYVAFPEMTGANRMSMYMYVPPGVQVVNRNPTYSSPVNNVNIGPYNNVGGHWYHRYCVSGGGWVKFIVDGHPQWNNSWGSASDSPLGSGAINDYGVSYFDTMYRFYITFVPYSGIDTPPYFVMVDEIETSTESEPQNNETINSPSVGWYPDKGEFEISFNDKYLNVATSKSTYELRYSFSPITNANFSSCPTAVILADARFNRLTGSNSGIIVKQWPYYEEVWAPFKLQPEDHSRVTRGSHIYFAIKDVSQNPSDLTLVNTAYNNGRPYTTYPDVYDYAGDSGALPLVKLIDYVVSSVDSPATYDPPTITGPTDFSTTSASVEIEGTYTVDSELTVDTVTWTLGESSGFCVAALGVFSCTVPVELGANSIVFAVTDSNSGTDSDTTVVTRAAVPQASITNTSISHGVLRH